MKVLFNWPLLFNGLFHSRGDPLSLRRFFVIEDDLIKMVIMIIWIKSINVLREVRKGKIPYIFSVVPIYFFFTLFEYPLERCLASWRWSDPDTLKLLTACCRLGLGRSWRIPGLHTSQSIEIFFPWFCLTLVNRLGPLFLLLAGVVCGWECFVSG